jgi:hypothetical protein
MKQTFLLAGSLMILSSSIRTTIVTAFVIPNSVSAFHHLQRTTTTTTTKPTISSTSKTALFMTDEVKAAQIVTGGELELMLTEWDLPLVVDAYATWYVALLYLVSRGRVVGVCFF